METMVLIKGMLEKKNVMIFLTSPGFCWNAYILNQRRLKQRNSDEKFVVKRRSLLKSEAVDIA